MPKRMSTEIFSEDVYKRQGVHVGKLKGYTAEEVLRDEDKLVECLLEANKLYTPDGMPIIFDLQVEAEILGCDLMWAENNPPSVKSHPLSGEKSIPCNCKIPTPESGRLPMILSIIIETQGGAGVENQLKQKDIDEAACVVLVNDVALEGLDRFKGKKVLKMGVSDLIKKSDAVMKKIQDTFQ